MLSIVMESNAYIGNYANCLCVVFIVIIWMNDIVDDALCTQVLNISEWLIAKTADSVPQDPP